MTPADFTVSTAPDLLAGGDPWAAALPEPQELPADLIERRARDPRGPGRGDARGQAPQARAAAIARSAHRVRGAPSLSAAMSEQWRAFHASAPRSGIGPDAGMWVGRIVGLLLVLVGAVWTLQGFGVVGGSSMTGSTTWLVIGSWWGHRGARARASRATGRRPVTLGPRSTGTTRGAAPPPGSPRACSRSRTPPMPNVPSGVPVLHRPSRVPRRRRARRGAGVAPVVRRGALGRHARRRHPRAGGHRRGPPHARRHRRGRLPAPPGRRDRPRRPARFRAPRRRPAGRAPSPRRLGRPGCPDERGRRGPRRATSGAAPWPTTSGRAPARCTGSRPTCPSRRCWTASRSPTGWPSPPTARAPTTSTPRPGRSTSSTTATAR